MHTLLAETIPGLSTQAVAEYAKKYNLYVVFGMSEKADDSDLVYNSAAIIYPDGRTESYRKLHLPFDEAQWAVRGDKPVLIDTPWGRLELRFAMILTASLSLSATIVRWEPDSA